MKKTVLGVMIGLLLGTGITVFAATLMAKDVTYAPSNSKWKVNNVGSALDDLYTNAKVSLNKFCELKSGDALAIGSMYECDPGDGIKRNFYVLEVRNNEVDLIMEQNIAKGTMTWYNAMKYFSNGAGSSIKSAWTNVLNIDLPKAQAIANAVGNSSWKAAENNAMQEGIYFNSLGKTLDEIQEDYPEYKNEPVNSLSPLFILSNKSKKFGASVITLPGVLEKVAERLDDSFLCIPSSIHEWLILRDKDGEYFSQDEIRHTILEVNSSCVDEGEFLSNNLYHYDRMRKKFEIVDE